MTHAIGLAGRIRSAFPGRRVPVEPALVPGKVPADVYRRLLVCTSLLRDIAQGKSLGDTTTLADPTVIESLKKKYEDEA